MRLEGQDSYCFGIIGQGGTFCLNKVCGLKHRGSRFNVSRAGDVFVLKSVSRAFCEPALSADDLAPDLLESWLSQSLPLETWRQMFLVANTGTKANQPKGSALSMAEITLQSIKFEEAKVFRTPAKRVRGASEEFGEEYSPHKRILIDKMSFLEEGGDALAVLEAVESNLASTGQLLVSTMESSNRSFRDQMQSIQMLEKRIDDTASTIGSAPPSLAEAFSAPTVWGAMAEMASTLSANQESSLERIDNIASQLGNFPSPVPAVFAGAQSVWDAIAVGGRMLDNLFQGGGVALPRQILESISAGVKSSIGLELAPLLVKHEGLKQLVQQVLAHVTSKFVSSVQVQESLSARLSMVEQRLSATTVVPGGDPSVNSHQDSPKLMGNLLERIHSLEAQLKQLKSESHEGSIKFASLGFRSITEVRAWAEKFLVPVALPFGLFPCIYTILDCVGGETDNDQKLLSNLERSKKLQLTSGAEARAIAAFEFKVPRLLHKETGSAVKRGESHLRCLPTYDDWWNDGMGLKERLSEELPAVEHGFRAQLDDRLEGGSVAHSIASQAVTQSVAWVGDLSRFIDDTFESLIRSGFTKASAWSLTTKLVHRIFHDLHAARAGVLQSFRPGDNESICAQVLWGVFKTHDVMLEYKRYKFKNHPSIASEYVKFLASNSGNDLIDKVSSRVGTVETKMKELSTTVGSAQNKVSEARSLVEALSARVKKLESK